MKKILIVIPTLGLGGAEDIVVRLSNYLSTAYVVDLLVLQRVQEDKSRVERLQDGVNLIEYFAKQTKTGSIPFKIRNLILWIGFLPVSVHLYIRHRLWSYAVIHVNLTKPALYSIVWSRLLGKAWSGKIIQTFHTNLHLLKWYARKIFIKSWQVASKTIVEIDPRELSKVAAIVGSEKSLYIPFAVEGANVNRFTRGKGERLRIGSLARLRIFEKKYDIILKALFHLYEKGVDFEYHIGGDGPDRLEIESIISELGLDDRVYIHGYVAPEALFSK